ncbi:MAG: alginate export family protein [Verrucomicrobia bacterium]|nr:alginate export family protein [Verrucomicrobiota bacterium]
MKIRLLTCLTLALPAAASAADAATDFLAKGKLSVNARARYESVDQSNLRDGVARTLRTRVGYTTADLSGWKAMIEGENVATTDGDSYSQAGINPAATGKAVVADAETTELNQLWLSYTTGKTTSTLGRQRLVLDNARFIGDVGWRQNQQTFDAFVLQDKTIAQTTLTYAYLDQINRVFSRRHAQGKFDSESHVLHAARAGLPGGATLTGYGYLLDFKNSAPNSCATWGASYVGTQKLNDTFKFAYRAEYARQSDYGSSTLNYESAYKCIEAGLVTTPGSLTYGYELLGSDRNVGFKTPLATLHAFNGWADMFLTTPAAGLANHYVKGTANLPGAVAFTVFYHWYETDATSTKLGEEFNAIASRKFGKYLTAAVKYAEFTHKSAAFPDVRKVWVQLEFVY